MCMYDLKVWFSTGLVLLERKQKPDLSADPGPPNNSLYIRPKMNLFPVTAPFFDNNILKSKHMTQWLKKKKKTNCRSSIDGVKEEDCFLSSDLSGNSSVLVSLMGILLVY